MTKNEIRTLSQGKYAEQRKTVLENHAPKVLAAMQKKNYLEEHLASIQATVSDYVELCVDCYKKSAEYLETENLDSLEAMRLLNMTVLEAENAAYRQWIANIPDDDEDEIEDYDEESDEEDE